MLLPEQKPGGRVDAAAAGSRKALGVEEAESGSEWSDIARYPEQRSGASVRTRSANEREGPMTTKRWREAIGAVATMAALAAAPAGAQTGAGARTDVENDVPTWVDDDVRTYRLVPRAIGADGASAPSFDPAQRNISAPPALTPERDPTPPRARPLPAEALREFSAGQRCYDASVDPDHRIPLPCGGAFNNDPYQYQDWSDLLN